MRTVQFWAMTFLVMMMAAAPALAQGQVSQMTREFVMNATIAGSFEIASSQLALEKSKSASVKEFARKMIDDHTKADKELKATIQSSGLDRDLTPATLDDKHQKMYDELKTAANFDQAYIAAQKKAHLEAVSLFSDYSENGDHAALKQFAAKTLPVLKEHEQHVKALKS